MILPYLLFDTYFTISAGSAEMKSSSFIYLLKISTLSALILTAFYSPKNIMSNALMRLFF